MDEGIVNVYSFDEQALQQYKVLIFPEYTIDWLDFVVANRNGQDSGANNYDAIEGGVANDQVIDTIEDYEMGRITADQALDQLKYKRPNHQICIRSQELLDKLLKYSSSYIVKAED